MEYAAPCPCSSSSGGFHNALCAVPGVRHQTDRLSVQQTLTRCLPTEQKGRGNHHHNFVGVSTTKTQAPNMSTGLAVFLNAVMINLPHSYQLPSAFFFKDWMQ